MLCFTLNTFVLTQLAVLCSHDIVQNPSRFVISREKLKKLDTFKETDEIARTDNGDEEEIIANLKM